MKKKNALLMICFCFFAFSGSFYGYAEENESKDSWRYENDVLLQAEEPNMETGLSDEGVLLFSSKTPTAKGIDVSYAQASIDWEVVKDEIDFAIIRCGYGNDLTEQDDIRWKYNADECTRLGIPFGVYLFSYAHTTEEAKSEAEHVLRLIDGYQLSLPVFMDLELRSQELLSSDEKKEMIKTFCDTITSAGYKAGIYANTYWWNTFLTDPIYHHSGWCQWVAHYSSKCGYYGDYSLWQYSCTGKVNGIKGNVDLNHWVIPLSPLDVSCFSENGESEKDAISKAMEGLF